MDRNEHYKELQEIVSELGITVTDETKPTELFEAVLKLLAIYAAEQPTADEIAENIKRRLRRDTDIIGLSRGR